MAKNKQQQTPKTYTGLNRFFRSEFVQILLNKLDDGTFSEFMGDWRWIFQFSMKYKWVVVFYTLFGIVSATFSLGAAYASRTLINIVVEKEFQKLWLVITIMLTTTVVSLVMQSVLGRISLRITIYVNNDIQGEIFDKILDARWVDLTRYPDGDLLNRFNEDVKTISENAISWIPDLIINLYTFTATFVILFRMDPTMAGIAILSAPFLLLMSRFMMKRLRQYRQRILELNSQMMSFEVETFSNLDMIKSFGVFGRYSGILRGWQEKRKEYRLDYNWFYIKSKIMMTLVSTAVSMCAFLYCLYRLWTGRILYGDMTFFLQQRSTLTGLFNKLVSTIPGMVDAATSAHRIRELVELPREEHDPELLERMKAVADDGFTVELSDVSFAYREGAEVYEHTNFVAKPNEIVAIVGASGQGKTTLLRLVLGLIETSAGEVALRTANGDKVAVNADLRQLFSYVPQGNTAVSGTIADNLRMVKEDATEEEIIEALQIACAWEFVEKMPDGIYSRIGEHGKGLSEGQAQRISIARAVLRDAPILLLDEATSALDMDTERQVLQNIIRQRPNKTCIISTHRTAVLQLCQRVYRIEDKGVRIS